MSQSPKWTLAQIREANSRTHEFFFTAMSFFGDTMKSFRVRQTGDEVLIVRVKPWRLPSGTTGGMGELYVFHPDTGKITPKG